MKKLLFASFTLIYFQTQTQAQGLLDDLSDPDEEKQKVYTIATFKGARLVNGHTVEAPAKNEAIFIIGHRFGRLNTGLYEMFGLDQASMRIGMEYSPIERLSIGAGRSTFQKNYDGFLKYKLFKQAKNGSPVSVSLLSSIAINTLRWTQPDRDNLFTSRLSYTYQALIARKFSQAFSLQLMPTLVHKNLVPNADDSNDILAMGAGGRLKLTNRVSLNAEYYYIINRNTLPRYNGLEPTNAIAIGFDIETGGHVFQLHFTNAQAMFEKGFIAENTGNFFGGDIFFGFNITRTFGF
jgi:hypothetical protein